MFLIDSIKSKVKKKLKTCFFFGATMTGSIQNKTSFVSFCFRTLFKRNEKDTFSFLWDQHLIWVNPDKHLTRRYYLLFENFS